MSSFSRSSRKSHYRNPNQGNGYYKKKGGFFGQILNQFGSFSSKNKGYYDNGHSNSPVQNQESIMSNVSCSKCGSQVPDGSKFCLECGQPITTATFCISCGEKLPAGAKFCMKCGQKLV